MVIVYKTESKCFFDNKIYTIYEKDGRYEIQKVHVIDSEKISATNCNMWQAHKKSYVINFKIISDISCYNCCLVQKSQTSTEIRNRRRNNGSHYYPHVFCHLKKEFYMEKEKAKQPKDEKSKEKKGLGAQIAETLVGDQMAEFISFCFDHVIPSSVTRILIGMQPIVHGASMLLPIIRQYVPILRIIPESTLDNFCSNFYDELKRRTTGTTTEKTAEPTKQGQTNTMREALSFLNQPTQANLIMERLGTLDEKRREEFLNCKVNSKMAKGYAILAAVVDDEHFEAVVKMIVTGSDPKLSLKSEKKINLAGILALGSYPKLKGELAKLNNVRKKELISHIEVMSQDQALVYLEALENMTPEKFEEHLNIFLPKLLDLDAAFKRASNSLKKVGTAIANIDFEKHDDAIRIADRLANRMF